MISAVFLLYCSALQTSLACVQGFSLMVTTHKSTVLKVNGMTEDIFICCSFFRSKNFLYLVMIRYKKENEATKFLFLGGRRDQGIKGITWNINKPKMTLLKTFYKPFLFKPIECMDTIRVVRFLRYKSMMGVSCFKLSFFLC